ncbi:cell division protein FtsQ [Agromyces terreus]|uniref:Cell division protein FtsQ n=1 Tax=Agromyces terreus TaxID=424795 RepID=A0A9X2KCK0_9MICO|nr:FtsQ-type POTRA domain-containing protein [Agromyces terreus]MCP2371709.1 cell division protein FtsQ [Agromyces terreus]
MKRPQGFERPAQARPAAKPRADTPRPQARASGASRQGEQARRTAASGGMGGSADGVAHRPGPGAADAAHTEPIEVGPSPESRPAWSASADQLGEPAPARGTTARGRWSTRRAIAAAARERRRYERAEVRRFTVRSRRRRLAWGVSLGTLGLLVAAVVVGAYSPIMALRDVRVEGASRVSADGVTSAFEPMLGTPLTLIDRGEVQAALSQFPLIETYQIEAIPPGTLVVRLVERTPVGVIETDDGLELVDAAGVVIERPEARPDGQPLIEVDGGVASEGFRAVAAVVRSLPAEVRSLVTGASAETADDVVLELGDARVVWGSAEDSALKAAVLAGLMRAAPPDTVELYDVSSPKSAVTR